MPIREFELWHGAVLTKICRNDKPLRLTLIEASDSRAAYSINSEVILYIKYSVTPSSTRRGKKTWQFTFQADHINDLAHLRDQAEVYMALVCGGEDREICLLYPHEITDCIDLKDESTQWLRVELEAQKSLRAYGSITGEDDKLVIERNRVEKWQVPGR